VEVGILALLFGAVEARKGARTKKILRLRSREFEPSQKVGSWKCKVSKKAHRSIRTTWEAKMVWLG